MMTAGGPDVSNLHSVELRLPPDPGYLRLARYAAADAAARAGLGLDETDDLRLAVSEAAGLVTGSDVAIDLRFEASEGVVVVSGEGAVGPGYHGENGELARSLVEAVVDELEFTVEGVRARFRIVKS